MAATCTHVQDHIKKVKPLTKGCEECLKTGDKWVHLRMCLAAIVTGAAGVSGLLGPLEDRQFLVRAMNDHPPHRTLSLFAANLTSINCVYHSKPRCLRFF